VTCCARSLRNGLLRPVTASRLGTREWLEAQVAIPGRTCRGARPRHCSPSKAADDCETSSGSDRNPPIRISPLLPPPTGLGGLRRPLRDHVAVAGVLHDKRGVVRGSNKKNPHRRPHPGRVQRRAFFSLSSTDFAPLASLSCAILVFFNHNEPTNDATQQAGAKSSSTLLLLTWTCAWEPSGSAVLWRSLRGPPIL